MLSKQKSQAYGLIGASAILIVLLFHLRLVQLLIDVFLLGNAPPGQDGDFNRKFRFTYYLPAVQMVMFLTLALFNYESRRLIKIRRKTLRVLTLIIINVGLVVLVAAISDFIFETFIDVREGRIRRLGYNFFLYSSYPLAGVAIAEAYFLILLERFRKSELEKAQLQEERTQAMMTALKEQLSPHFFFNTLSSLSTIVRNEPKEAGLEFIQAMSNTYRYTLTAQQDTVTVEEELDFFDSYTYMLKKRFGNKLVINQNLEQQTLSYRIPPMSLQILLENVIQHNVLTEENPVLVDLYTDSEYFCVKNTLIEKSSSSGSGIGLRNLSERYELLAGKQILIEKTDTYFQVKLPLL